MRSLSNERAVGAIKVLTDGQGASAMFDFVGVQATVEIAGAAAATEAAVSIVGIGGGALRVGIQITAWDVAVRAPYWGSRSDRSGPLGVSRPITDADHSWHRL
jgi:propanol-preferring alcohol dehydrogenase